MARQTSALIVDGVQCPQCNGESHVVDSRDVEHAKRRRRQCNKCEHRYTTYEIHVEEYNRKVLTINTTQIDSMIATLREIKVKFGATNGHHQD